MPACGWIILAAPGRRREVTASNVRKSLTRVVSIGKHPTKNQAKMMIGGNFVGRGW
jgi:hypothetical protein